VVREGKRERETLIDQGTNRFYYTDERVHDVEFFFMKNKGMQHQAEQFIAMLEKAHASSEGTGVCVCVCVCVCGCVCMCMCMSQLASEREREREGGGGRERERERRGEREREREESSEGTGARVCERVSLTHPFSHTHTLSHSLTHPRTHPPPTHTHDTRRRIHAGPEDARPQPHHHQQQQPQQQQHQPLGVGDPGRSSQNSSI
jgi:hypothetical protein